MGNVVKISTAPRFSAANFKDVAHKKLGSGPIGEQILGLARAAQGEFELSEKEARRTRTRIYWINKNHPRGYRFRTLYEDGFLLVWRIR